MHISILVSLSLTAINAMIDRSQHFLRFLDSSKRITSLVNSSLLSAQID